MKIAVATNSQDSDAQVSNHAARAPYFLVYDEDGAFLGAITNPFSSVERGAALKASQLLQEHGVSTLIAGEFGDRFIFQLEEHSITTVLAKGSVSNAIKNVFA
jgi:predicted Fe-Mo cluster-binding NifX family protein